MMMRTTITMDDGLLADLKRRAAESGDTLSGAIESLVRLALAAESARPQRQFELITFGRGGARPGVDLDRTSELLVAEDVEVYRKDRDPS